MKGITLADLVTIASQKPGLAHQGQARGRAAIQPETTQLTSLAAAFERALTTASAKVRLSVSGSALALSAFLSEPAASRLRQSRLRRAANGHGQDHEAALRFPRLRKRAVGCVR